MVDTNDDAEREVAKPIYTPNVEMQFIIHLNNLCGFELMHNLFLY